MIKDAHLDFWIQNNYNVLFVGKKGVGKTSIIKAAFERNHLNWKYFSASTLDPWVDLVGVPREKIDENGHPYLDLIRPKDLQDDTIQAFFFDEYNRAAKKVKNAVMELIQFKSINGKKFNNLKIIWAAINPADDEDEAYDVEPLDPAQEDRFHVKVNIPYLPDLKYFSDKYGLMGAKAAVEWWKDLPKPTQNQISPRRLDYALDIYSKGGDLNYVLPHSSNIGKLIQGLANGPMQDKLSELLKIGDKSKAEVFIKIENNYISAINFILKNRDLMSFFLPLLEEEKLASLLASCHKKKFKNGLVEFMVSQTKTCEVFKHVINDIIKSKTNKELTVRLVKEIGNCRFEEDYGILNLGYATNTYERMKVLVEMQGRVSRFLRDNSSTEKDFEKSLIIIDSIIKHTQKSTIKNKKFIANMIRDCISKLSYKDDKNKITKMFPSISDKCIT